MTITNNNQAYDFTASDTVVAEVPQSLIDIIEFNSGSQTETRIGYSVITWVDGVPTEVKKYTDNTMTLLTDTITITWLGGVPTTTVRVNHLDTITVTTTIEWLNGVPVSITKV